jgi:hypothetical protein
MSASHAHIGGAKGLHAHSNVKTWRAAKGSQTAKTKVLPGFLKIEHGGGKSGRLVM